MHSPIEGAGAAEAGDAKRNENEKMVKTINAAMMLLKCQLEYPRNMLSKSFLSNILTSLTQIEVLICYAFLS